VLREEFEKSTPPRAELPGSAAQAWARSEASDTSVARVAHPGGHRGGRSSAAVVSPYSLPDRSR